MLYDSKKWNVKTDYLTAKQLGVPERVREAFVAVHQAMLRGEIPSDRFDMKSVGDPNWDHKHCGTPGCILGWAEAYSEAKGHSTQQINFSVEVTHKLHSLCYPAPHAAITCCDPQVACKALGNWLITGAPRWREVLRQS